MFVVLEIQGNGETATVLSNSYLNRSEAEAKYYTILAIAAASDVPVHSAVLLTQEGYFCKSECFKHETEPNEE